MRKPHAKSKLKNLPADVQARIADWCAQDSLESAVSRCSAELAIETNRSSMSEFFAWWNLRQTFGQADARAKAVPPKPSGPVPNLGKGARRVSPAESRQ